VKDNGLRPDIRAAAPQESVVGESPRYALVLPVRDEEESLPWVLDALTGELAADLEDGRLVIAAGLNACRDRSGEVLRGRGILCGETSEGGYGHGCMAAIEAVRGAGIPVSGWIFYAADGANDPRDIPRLVAEHQRGTALVLGSRTRRMENWLSMGLGLVLGNLVLAGAASLAARKLFTDLGPLRLIDAGLFERLDLRELTYGWTVEAQVRAARLGARIVEVPVRDRPRVAGRQKVAGLGWGHSWRVARNILGAAFRSAGRKG
jgi:hypothetical protein